MNCPTTRCSTPAAAPRIGLGESALPGQDPGAKTSPSRSPPSRTSIAARTPGSRGTELRSCSRQPYSNTPGPGTPAGRPTADWPRTSAAASGPSAMPWQPFRRPAGSRVEHGASNPTGRVIWLTCVNRGGNPPHSLKPVGPTPQNGWGAPPQTGWTRIQNRGRRRERRIPKIRVRTITTGDPSDPDTGPRVLRRPDPTPGTPGCARLPARQFAAVPHFPTWVPALAPAPPVIDPPQPELSVAAPAPVVAPPQPQSPTLRKVGLGPRAAYPAIRTPSAWSLPAPSPRPGPASLPLTPELSVAAPAPVVVPPQPQSPTLRKLGLGPRGAHPALKTPPAGS